MRVADCADIRGWHWRSRKQSIVKPPVVVVLRPVTVLCADYIRHFMHLVRTICVSVKPGNFTRLNYTLTISVFGYEQNSNYHSILSGIANYVRFPSSVCMTQIITHGVSSSYYNCDDHKRVYNIACIQYSVHVYMTFVTSSQTI